MSLGVSLPSLCGVAVDHSPCRLLSGGALSLQILGTMLPPSPGPLRAVTKPLLLAWG